VDEAHPVEQGPLPPKANVFLGAEREVVGLATFDSVRHVGSSNSNKIESN
jgi:hypothetical protein